MEKERKQVATTLLLLTVFLLVSRRFQSIVEFSALCVSPAVVGSTIQQILFPLLPLFYVLWRS